MERGYPVTPIGALAIVVFVLAWNRSSRTDKKDLYIEQILNPKMTLENFNCTRILQDFIVDHDLIEIWQSGCNLASKIEKVLPENMRGTVPPGELFQFLRSAFRAGFRDRLPHLPFTYNVPSSA